MNTMFIITRVGSSKWNGFYWSSLSYSSPNIPILWLMCFTPLHILQGLFFRYQHSPNIWNPGHNFLWSLSQRYMPGAVSFVWWQWKHIQNKSKWILGSPTQVSPHIATRPQYHGGWPNPVHLQSWISRVWENFWTQYNTFQGGILFHATPTEMYH